MGEVRRRTVFRIDAHEIVGERMRVDGYLSRTGIQIYQDGFGKERREYRPPQEVFDSESMASLRGMPVTIRHPRNTFVDGDNWRKFTVGFVGDDVRMATNGSHTLASVWVIDRRTQERIRDGELKELSVGYTAELEMTPGVTDSGERFDAIQRRIRGNHLALLPQGHARGGPTVALRLDATDHVIFDDDDTDTDIGGPSEVIMAQKVTIRADGYDYVGEFADDKVGVALEKDRASAKARADEQEKRIGALEAKLDESEKKIAELESRLADATDPEKLAAAAESRKAFDENLALVAAEGFDRSSVKTDSGKDPSDIQLMAAALESRGIEIADATDARIEGRFMAEADIARANASDVRYLLTEVEISKLRKSDSDVARVRKALYGDSSSPKRAKKFSLDAARRSLSGGR